MLKGLRAFSGHKMPIKTLRVRGRRAWCSRKNDAEGKNSGKGY